MEDNHQRSPADIARSQEQDRIAKEMAPFFFHIIWPVLIIAVIAKIFAPSTF